MQVETIYTFKNDLYIVKSGFLSQNNSRLQLGCLQNKVEKICLISWGHFFIKRLLHSHLLDMR